MFMVLNAGTRYLQLCLLRDTSQKYFWKMELIQIVRTS